MRIDGVTGAPATRREARRGQPGATQFDERFRFSVDGYILDLTVEAMRRTGRGDMRAARYVAAPPESYNEAGELAYYDPPERPMRLARRIEIAPEPDDPPPPPPMVSFVAFDGMLRSL